MTEKSTRESVIGKLMENAIVLQEQECKPMVLTEGSGWLVAAGGINVFVSAMKQDGSFGRRVFVTHLDAGELLFPAVFFEYKDEKFCLLADSLSETSIVGLSSPWHKLLAGEDKDVADFIRTGFYSWIEKLSMSFLHDNVPTACKLIPAPVSGLGWRAGYSTGDSFRPEHGIVWVTVKEGFCVLCGDEENALLAEGSVFPLSQHLWLKSIDETEVEFEAAETITSATRILPMFNLFYGTFYRTILLAEVYLSNTAQTNCKRLSDQENKALAATIDNLASLNDTAKDINIDLSGAALAEPCLAVLEVVFQSMGMVFKFNEKIPEDLVGEKLLCAILERSSTYYRRIRLVGKWWQEESGGMTAFRKTGEPVALVYDRHTGYKVFLPEGNKFVPMTQEIGKQLSDTAFCIYSQLPSTKLNLKDIVVFSLKTLRPAFFFLGMMGIIASIVGLITPYITGIIFNSVIPRADIFQLCQIGVILVTAAITTTMFSITRSFVLLRIKTVSDYRLQAAIVGRLLRLPLPIFKRYSTGDMTQRIMGVESMRAILTDNVTGAVLSLFLAIPNLLLMCWYSWKLALCGLAAILVFMIFIMIMGVINYVNQKNQMRVSGELSGLVLQIITGINKIRHSISENRAFIKWAAKFEEETRWYVRGIKNSNFIMIFDTVYPTLITALFFYLVGETWKGTLNVGDYLSFNSAFSALMAAATGLGGIVPSLIALIPLYQRMKPVLDELPESDDSLKFPGELDGQVEIKNLFYRYNPGAPLTVKDLNITVTPGEFIALVGPSGAGKSTIIRMLLGFENPESGGIYYSGRDLATLNKRELRKQIGTVLQSDSLIEDSIYHNITGASNMSIEEAWEAARMAGCAKDIENMPMRMHTMVGNSTVSGGQKQRILIARAMAKKPRIIIFDEATSAVDNETQSHISDSLRKLNATRIIVAHRLSTIKHADRIYVLSKGIVVLVGDFNELINTPGIFSNLAKRQMV